MTKAEVDESKPKTSIMVNMIMASCKHCHGPIARIDMPGAPDQYNHVINQSEDCS